MNYQLIYDSLIERGKTRSSLKEDFEIHHIIPKSLGGSDSKCNLVKLTYREHFIAHWILAKTLKGKMIYAFWKMCTSKSGYKNSLAYEHARKDFIAEMRKRILSNETRSKISKSLLGKKKTKEHRKNIKLAKNNISDETRAKMSESAKTKIFSDSHRMAMSKAREKVIISDEIRAKMSSTHKKIQRKFPHWEYYKELFDFWIWLDKPGRKLFRKTIVKFGYPDLDYASMIINFKNDI